MNLIKKYALLMLIDGKFMVARDSGENYYKMPGGKPELDEAPEEALAREIKEELGVDVVFNTLKFFGKFEDVAMNKVDTIVQINLFIGEIRGDPVPSGEIEEVAWIDSSCDPKLLSPIILNKIIPALKKDGLID